MGDYKFRLFFNASSKEICHAKKGINQAKRLEIDVLNLDVIKLIQHTRLLFIFLVQIQGCYGPSS